MRHVAFALAAVAAVSFASPAQATSTLISEDFETGLGVFTPSGQVAIYSGQDYATCCGSTGGAADLANHFVGFGSGGQPSGTITSPTFTLLVNETYTLTFDYTALGQLGASEDIIAHLGPAFVTFSPISVNSLGSFLPATLNVTFFDMDHVGNLSFTTSGGASVDGVIDNVVLTTTADQAPLTVPGVPEPATWAMMLLGFGAVGIAMRRRRVAALSHA